MHALAAAHGLQGLHALAAAHGLQGLHALAAQGLHFLAAHAAICTEVSAALAAAPGSTAAPVARVATLRATMVFLIMKNAS